ncbi:MAG TPA: 30S ribosomal protein S9 [Rhabdochlamydiaceae bacterium]|nr:30S ribosomal protein S9 [Rhabdochlamydiaceae bacterium]
MKEFIGTGRRKTAVTSVRLRPGKGKITVNGREFENYFPTELQRKIILSPFEKFGFEDKYDIIMTIRGGGVQGQVVAARLGISRALVQEEEERRKQLKDLGYLTRDPRKRERKKYGLAGARKRFQFSKR